MEGRFVSRQHNSREVPLGTGVEHMGRHGVEGPVLRENYWLAQFITPYAIERLQQQVYRTSSREFLIFLQMHSAVENGTFKSIRQQSRLLSLIPVYSHIAITNMRAEEQEVLQEFVSHINAVEILRRREKVRKDIQWIWSTFGLRIPTLGIGNILLTEPSKP